MSNKGEVCFIVIFRGINVLTIPEVIFTHLKSCLADAIHNFKWVEIIQIGQNGGELVILKSCLLMSRLISLYLRWYLMC